MGGSLAPASDPTRPFDVPEEWRPDLAHGRAGLRLLRRGAPPSTLKCGRSRPETVTIGSHCGANSSNSAVGTAIASQSARVGKELRPVKIPEWEIFVRKRLPRGRATGHCFGRGGFEYARPDSNQRADFPASRSLWASLRHWIANLNTPGGTHSGRNSTRFRMSARVMTDAMRAMSRTAPPTVPRSWWP